MEGREQGRNSAWPLAITAYLSQNFQLGELGPEIGSLLLRGVELAPLMLTVPLPPGDGLCHPFPNSTLEWSSSFATRELAGD